MSNFYEDASLVMVPSGYKDQKVYSSVPDDGSADLTFSRGSDIEATRVASNGYIEKAKVNLLLQSNSFDTTWALSSATITGGQSGYDGTSDAWLLDASIDGGSIRQNSSVSGVHTFSIYAKKGSADGIRVRVDQTTAANIYIDLTDGSVHLAINDIATSVQDVGSGWYKVTFTMLNAGLLLFRIYPTDGTVNAVAGTIYIQDAQLNYGLVAQEYQETTTTSVVAGITNDMPRLDYSGGASCPSLLLEPSRQNLLTNDTYYGGSDWSKIGVSPSANNATSPEGVTNAVLLSETAINDQHSLYPTVSVTSGNAYTASCLVSQSRTRYKRFRLLR